MNIAEIEAEIRAAVAAAKADGWRIMQGIYYAPQHVGTPWCCPLGAVVRGGVDVGKERLTIDQLSDRALIRDKAAEVLGMTWREAQEIVHGFDGCFVSRPTEFHMLGARLRDLVDDGPV